MQLNGVAQRPRLSAFDGDWVSTEGEKVKVLSGACNFESSGNGKIKWCRLNKRWELDGCGFRLDKASNFYEKLIWKFYEKPDHPNSTVVWQRSHIYAAAQKKRKREAEESGNQQRKRPKLKTTGIIKASFSGDKKLRIMLKQDAQKKQAEAHAQKSSSAPKELDDTEMEPPNKEGSNTAELVLSDSDDDHARKRLLKLKGLSDISEPLPKPILKQPETPDKKAVTSYPDDVPELDDMDIASFFVTSPEPSQVVQHKQKETNTADEGFGELAYCVDGKWEAEHRASQCASCRFTISSKEYTLKFEGNGYSEDYCVDCARKLKGVQERLHRERTNRVEVEGGTRVQFWIQNRFVTGTILGYNKLKDEYLVKEDGGMTRSYNIFDPKWSFSFVKDTTSCRGDRTLISRLAKRRQSGEPEIGRAAFCNSCGHSIIQSRTLFRYQGKYDLCLHCHRLLHNLIIMQTKNLRGLARFLKSDECKKAYVVLGPEVSKGLDYWSSDDLYRNLTVDCLSLKSSESAMLLLDPSKVFSLDFFRRNPKAFFEVSRNMLLAKHTPSAPHAFLKALQQTGKLGRVLTLTIDGLERQIQLPNDKVIQVNGGLGRPFCADCKQWYNTSQFKRNVLAGVLPVRCKCGGYVRPGSRLFDEPLSEEYAEAARPPHAADLFLMLGADPSKPPLSTLHRNLPEHTIRVLMYKQNVRVSEPGGFDTENDRDFYAGSKIEDVLMLIAREVGWASRLRRIIQKMQGKGKMKA